MKEPRPHTIAFRLTAEDYAIIQRKVGHLGSRNPSDVVRIAMRARLNIWREEEIEAAKKSAAAEKRRATLAAKKAANNVAG